MFFEPVNYSKFESPKGSLRRNLVIPKSRNPSTMRNVESTSNTSISMRYFESTSGSTNQQIGAEDRNSSFSEYFSFKSLAVLVCITVSLLILPLVLPPLAPPPLVLLLVPIAILVLLLILALKYSSAPHIGELHM